MSIPLVAMVIIIIYAIDQILDLHGIINEYLSEHKLKRIAMKESFKIAHDRVRYQLASRKKKWSFQLSRYKELIRQREELDIRLVELHQGKTGVPELDNPLEDGYYANDNIPDILQQPDSIKDRIDEEFEGYKTDLDRVRLMTAYYTKLKSAYNTTENTKFYYLIQLPDDIDGMPRKSICIDLLHRYLVARGYKITAVGSYDDNELEELIKSKTQHIDAYTDIQSIQNYTPPEPPYVWYLFAAVDAKYDLTIKTSNVDGITSFSQLDGHDIHDIEYVVRSKANDDKQFYDVDSIKTDEGFLIETGIY